ncbi:MAG: histidine phosphatase family protein [Spirochaetales bacterium]|nr:histidine phosphatase family protein [Spirochaetales bacterium]
MIDFRQLDGRGNFYFLRHGESQGNSAGVIQGRHDYPLAPKGREQARMAARWFEERGIQALFSSPLKRAHETARIVADTLGLSEITVLPELNELDTGVFTDQTIRELNERHPEQWRSFQERSWEGVRGAEPAVELYARAERLWERLAREYGRGLGNLLCVTHSGIMQWIVKVTFGHRTWMPLVPFGNCGINHFSLDNTLAAKRQRYYFEWSRLNYQPFEESGKDGHLFLKGR